MAELNGPRLAPRVARSEDELIKLARGLVGSGRPPARARAAKPISKIGPTAMGLLQQTLARGVIASLLRAGGWENRRTLVDGHGQRGRLWERHASLPPLRFGPASFELLTWLRDEDLVRPSHKLARHDETTLADDVLHYLACEQLTRAGLDVHQPAFLRSPLCQLGYPEFLASGDPLPDVDFTPLTEEPGSIIVEALQSSLASRWVETEQRKGTIVVLEDMTRIGNAQTRVLTRWFAAIDRGAPPRRDLAGFLAEAARQLLARGPERRCPDHRWWIRSLSVQASLAARQSAFTAAAAFLRGLARLNVWLDEAGVVAHFDDDYEAAQLLLSSWRYLRERPEAPAELLHQQAALPASILDRAATLAHTLESLHSLGAVESAIAP